MKNRGTGHMEIYMKPTQQLLRQLGANGSYAGFKYTVTSICKTIQNPELIIYICKGLYTEVALQYEVNTGNVERNIRTVIETIWKSGNRELLNKVCGKQLTERPTNTFFIDAVSQYIIDSCEKQI